MNEAQKNWIWFLCIMALILGAGIYLGISRRVELGKSFNYSLDEYRRVDPALIQYTEVDPVVPTIGKISALAIAPDGRLFVGGENAVEIFQDSGIISNAAGDKNSKSLKKIRMTGTPTCLVVDEQGALFAGMQDHVEVVSADGKTVVWASPGEKAYLTSIAADDRFVYVADAGSRRIWRYNKKGGKPLEIGKKDPDRDIRGFFVPSPFFDIALSKADGSLWVVNPGHHALENYHSDGALISSWEAASMRIEGFSGCCNPSHFTLLPDGGFVTAEKGLPRVKIHNIDGSLRCVVAAPDQFEEGITGLDVAVDEQGRILVLDPVQSRVRVFEEKKQ